MIPIIFEAGSTTFTTNGLGRCADAIKCNVVEERNGVYELEMEYPISGIHYSDIVEDRLLLAKTSDSGRLQPFRIYKISRPMDGKVTVYAEHISYLLNKVICLPFTATSLTEAMSKIGQNSTTNPFTFTTFKTVAASFELKEPRPIRGLLGGEAGSLLSVYGKGEYEFDIFNVNLYTNRGVDNGVTIRYGKNLTDINHTTDVSNSYTGIVPYWKKTVDSVETVVTLTEKVVLSGHESLFAYPILKAVDFTNDFDDQPTQEQLRTRAQRYLSENEGWNTNSNLKISFLALWQTEEYKDVAVLQRVNLCDKVTVVYPDLGVNVKEEVIKTDYDVLNERYNSIELGDPKNNLAQQISDQISNSIPEDLATVDFMQEAINHATELITGGLGGYVVLKPNANGQPEELLVLDAQSGGNIASAVNVWRFNSGGLGHSSHGYSGPYDDVALTMDGHINGKYITAGTVSAYAVRTGLLEDQTGSNSWNLDTGVFKLAAATQVGTGSTATTLAQINVNSGNISAEVTRASQAEGSLSSRITANADSITAEVTRASQAEGSLSTRVGITEQGLTTKVEKNGIISSINQSAESVTINASKVQFVDTNNYSQLNETSAARWGFTYAAASGGAWFKMDTIIRDRRVSECFTVNGGETYRIKCGISSTCKGASSYGGSDSVYLRIGIGLYCYDGNGQNPSWSVPAQVLSNASGTEGTIDAVVTIPSGSRQMYVYVQTAGWPTFTGQVWVRNLTVTRMSGTDLIVDGSITANKIAANQLVVGDNVSMGPNAYITWGHVTNQPTIPTNTNQLTNGAGYITSSSLPTKVSDLNNDSGFVDSNTVTTITRNTVTAAYINTLHVTAGSVAASDITGDIISGKALTYYDENSGEPLFWIGHDLTQPGTTGAGVVWARNINVMDSQGRPKGGWHEDWQDQYGNPYNQNRYMRIYSGWGIHVGNEGSGQSLFDGYVYMLGGYGSSDRRLKTDITPLNDSDSANFIMGLEPVRFRFIKERDADQKVHHGFIAQDVQNVVQDDWDIVTGKDDEYKFLSYQEIIADLVSVVQQQQKRINDLETRLTRLEDILR